MLAIAEAMRIEQIEKRNDVETLFEIDELHLLSVGTGRAQFSLSPAEPDAGFLYWASRVAEVMGTLQVQGVHLPLKFFLDDRYRHVNFKMTEKWGLDQVKNIPKLLEVAEQRPAETFELVSEEFLQHKRIPFQPFTTNDMEIHLDEFGF